MRGCEKVRRQRRHFLKLLFFFSCWDEIKHNKIKKIFFLKTDIFAFSLTHFSLLFACVVGKSRPRVAGFSAENALTLGRLLLKDCIHRTKKALVDE